LGAIKERGINWGNGNEEPIGGYLDTRKSGWGIMATKERELGYQVS
jgi:hypothetical protein